MIADIAERLSEIKPANGYLFDVPEVVEQASNRVRGVGVEDIGGAYLLHCNATGRTLGQLKGYITELLADGYTVTDDGDESPLCITPKQTEADDATTETN